MNEESDRRLLLDGVPDFWERLRVSPSRCLILDYDGTLAPFRVNRMRAFPLDGVRDLIEAIRDTGKTHLAIVTGRPLRELLELLGDMRIPVSASQGVEYYDPEGHAWVHQPSPRQERRLARAADEAAELGLSSFIERKAASLALHTRPMAPEDAERSEEQLCAVWEKDAAANDLECRHFNGGIELRLLDIDKGTVLERLLDGGPPDAFCVYVGDDETDEDAFHAIRGRGIGVRVGDPAVPTKAEGRLADPAAVKEFLEAWLEITSRL